MSKIIIQDYYNEEINEWVFPKESHTEENKQVLEDEYLKNEQYATVPNKTEIEIKYEEKLAELENLKQEYLTKIALISEINNKIQSSENLINQELIVLIQDIIKKSVKKIIYKEMTIDPKIILEMIKHLKELIKENNGLLTIYLSPEDLNKLGLKNKKDVCYKADKKLSSGDLVVKSNQTEIRAILHERLEQLMEVCEC